MPLGGLAPPPPPRPTAGRAPLPPKMAEGRWGCCRACVQATAPHRFLCPQKVLSVSGQSPFSARKMSPTHDRRPRADLDPSGSKYISQVVKHMPPGRGASPPRARPSDRPCASLPPENGGEAAAKGQWRRDSGDLSVCVNKPQRRTGFCVCKKSFSASVKAPQCPFQCR